MDHRIIHDASLVALRPIHHRCSKILAYETLSETEWGIGFGGFEPRYYVDVTSTLKLKIKAMEVFETELKESSHPRSREGIARLAKKRGSEILVDAAEVFVPIRIIDV